MTSEAQKKASRKWNAENRQVIIANVDKKTAEIIRNHATDHGESVNAFLRRAALEQITRDNAPTPAPAPAAEARKRKHRKESPDNGQLMFSDED